MPRLNKQQRLELSAWSKLIRKFGGNNCQICRNRTANEAHHLASSSQYPQFRLDPTNGISICWQCHNELESDSKKLLREKLCENFLKTKGMKPRGVK